MTYEEWWDATDKDGTPFVNFTFGEEVWQAAREERLLAHDEKLVNNTGPRSPYSVEVIGLIDSEGVDGEKLQADLQRILDPYGLIVRVIGGVVEDT